MAIHDPSFHRKLLFPRDYAMRHSISGAVTQILRLVHAGGDAVLGIAYGRRFSVHPLAVYDQEGIYQRFDVEGLIGSRHPSFVYEIPADRPLRTIDDAKNLAIRWVAAYVDLPPRTRH